MKKNRELMPVYIFTLLISLLFVINNLLEYNFIPQRVAFSGFVASITYCILIHFMRRKYVYEDKHVIIKHIIVYFIPYIIVCIALYLLFGLNTWTRVIILLSGLIIAFFVLFKSLKKKQI